MNSINFKLLLSYHHTIIGIVSFSQLTLWIEKKTDNFRMDQENIYNELFNLKYYPNNKTVIVEMTKILANMLRNIVRASKSN